ncbi:cytochrome d ubiquinol oxidase subunit II [Allopusillimonas ginsengisoli]|uniref:cytochrome d ubiquinol oxidase subunit II n=1 Tax=Allopusillimonas ginsengisoli TaxID=453575 RepID=UPI001021AB7D|nr:cytochrome d ubiquinol oxidase subunit II [Allopusillimonas ginsengisoli]TEA77470.1 cytochrome d ubiquinol oxidase subunit II [Allopusillimonas ginsengisoli]
MIDTLAGALGFGVQDPSFWMPLVFMVLLFAIIVAAAVLDGFDIGVGCLALFAPAHLRPRMLGLLSPWRDANEFWLFLGLGLLLAAFPGAWGAIMGQLYLPLTLLGLGVLLRSISFEMRLRSPHPQQSRWLAGFAAGSLLTALSHGLLLAQIVVSYRTASGYLWFSAFIGLCTFAAYCLLGSAWLMMRVGGELRARSVMWGRRAVRWTAAGAVGVTVVLAFANGGIFLKWSDGAYPAVVPILWGVLLICFVSTEMCLQRMIHSSYRNTALPFVMTLLVFLIVLGGLGYSFFPYLVLDDITLWDAAASVPSLRLVLSCVVVAMPVALIFNLRVYWRMFGLSRPPEPPDFQGKTTKAVLLSAPRAASGVPPTQAEGKPGPDALR